MKQATHHIGKRLLAWTAVLACFLVQGAVGFLPTGAAGDTEAPQPTNILAGNASVAVHMIRHVFKWEDTYPEYQPSDFTAYDGGFIDDTKKAQLTDGEASAAITMCEKSPTTASIYQNRRALLYDLGKPYALSEIKLDISPTGVTQKRFLYSFSVYAGNIPDGSLLANRIGTGGGKEQVVSAKLTSKAPARYLLIVFNKLGTDPGNKAHVEWAVDGNAANAVPADQDVGDGSSYEGVAWANGGITLSEIEVLGTEAPSILAGKTNVTSYLVRHDFNWDEAQPEYTQGMKLNVNENPGAGQSPYRWIDRAKLTDGNFYVADNTAEGTGAGLPVGTDAASLLQMCQYRQALLYSLEQSYTLSEIVLHLQKNYQWGYLIHQFSVYAGNVPDESLLENRVGTGGGTGKTLSAKLECETPVRYLLIVFDKLGSDPGHKNHSFTLPDGAQPIGDGSQYEGVTKSGGTPNGGWYLSGIELFGEEAAWTPEAGNILAGNTSVTPYLVKHDFNWGETAPDYKPEDAEVLKAYTGYVTAAAPRLTDGKVDTAGSSYWNAQLQINGNGDPAGSSESDYTSESIVTHRRALLYDLGGRYDLSQIRLYLTQNSVQNNKYIYDFSVYAGNYPDGRILTNANRIGIGGGRGAVVSAELTGTAPARYLMIVFNKLGTDPGNKTSNVAVPGGKDIGAEHAELGCHSAPNGAVLLSEIELFGTASTDPEPESILKGNTDVIPCEVKHTFNWSDTYPDYTPLDFAGPANTVKNAGLLTDGSLDGGEAAIDLAGNAPACFTHRRAILYDLGKRYDLSEIRLHVLPRQANEFGRYVYSFSVYGGTEKSSRLLSAKNLLGTGGGAFADVDAQLDGSKPVRYLLIVFNKLGTDPGNKTHLEKLQQLIDDGADEEKIKPYRIPEGYNPGDGSGYTGCEWPNGGVYLSEIELFGTASAEQEPPVQDDPITGENILAGNKNLTLVHTDHPFSWSDTPEDYHFTAEGTSFNEELTGSELATFLTDGVTKDVRDEKGQLVTQFRSHGRGSSINLERRMGYLYDLGGYYNLEALTLSLGEFNRASGRVVYSFSVYTGLFPNTKIINNFVGRGIGTEFDTEVTARLKADKPARYVMIIMEMQGTDPGNLNDSDPAASGLAISEDSRTGCVWADSGIYLNEIELFGEETESPIEETTFSGAQTGSADTGVSVQILTYDNPVKIASMKLSKVPLTAMQKAVIQQEGMEAATEVYHIDFFNAAGERIVDMNGRQITVSVPMKTGTESLFGLNAMGQTVALDFGVDTDTNMLTYTFGDDIPAYFDFIMADFESGEIDPPDETDPPENNDPTGGFGGGDPTDGDDVSNTETGTAAPIAALAAAAGSGALALAVRKKRGTGKRP